MSDLIFHAPCEVKIKVFVTNDETQESGKATITMGDFEIPSKEDIKDRIDAFEKNELTGSLSGFRLMTKRESWEMLCLEMSGQVFAMPRGEEWDEI
jgi:hypothetical protein